MSLDLSPLAEATRLKNLGHSYGAISQTLGIPKTTIYRWLNPPHAPETPNAAAAQRNLTQRHFGPNPTFVLNAPAPPVLFQAPPTQHASVQPSAPTLLNPITVAQAAFTTKMNDMIMKTVAMPILNNSPFNGVNQHPPRPPLNPTEQQNRQQFLDQQAREQQEKQREEEKRTVERRQAQAAFWNNIQERRRADQESRAQLGRDMLKLQEDTNVKDQKRTQEFKEAIVTFVRDTNAYQAKIQDSYIQGTRTQFQKLEPPIDDGKVFEEDRQQDKLLRRDFEQLGAKIDARAQQQNAAARNLSLVEQFYMEQTQRMAEAKKKRQTVENICAGVAALGLLAKGALEGYIRGQAKKQG